jgi:hypothetical protein
MKFKIHPAIGIARVGDSPDGFYLAPEQAGALPNELTSDGKEQPITKFKDAQGRVKRQAARFRVFGYADDGTQVGKELQAGDTIEVVNQKSGMLMTGEVLDIEWTVYLANKKSSWYEFLQLDGEHGYDPTHPLRNADVTHTNARQQLIIDPGPQTVSYTDKKQRIAEFAAGKNPGYSQSFPPPLEPFSIDTLGELRAIQQDKNFRLLVFGGFGRSGSYKTGFGQPVITHYANNDGWFDDTSDGPVTARVKFKVLKEDGRPPSPATNPIQYAMVETPAWVIVGYPRFVPQMQDIITMDDLIYDNAVRYFGYNPYLYGQLPGTGIPASPDPSNPDSLRLWREQAQFNPNYYPYFYRDIWPILTRPQNYSFVMDFDAFTGGDPHNDTPGGGGNFDPNIISIPPYEGEDPNERKMRARHRAFIYAVLRKPGQENLWNAPVDPAKVGAENALRIPVNPARAKYAPVLMPFLCGDNPLSNTVPSKFLRLTDTQLFLLKQWADGKFINEQSEDIPVTNPDTGTATGTDIDRGVLSNLLGGSFCPGAEAAWIMRNPAIYSEPYRIKHSTYFNYKTLNSWDPQPLSLPGGPFGPNDAGGLAVGLEPGDLTKYSGIPWQSDFNECSNQPVDITYEGWNNIYPQSTGDPVQDVTQNTYWWPTHRPMQVSDPVLGSMVWSQGIPNNSVGDLKMVSAWSKLGFILNTGTEDNPNFIQVERNDAEI